MNFADYFSLEPIHYLGLIAGSLGVLGPIPQVIKCWLSKSTRDISIISISSSTTSTILWMIYGLIQGDKPLVICNTVGFLVGTLCISLKISYSYFSHHKV